VVFLVLGAFLVGGTGGALISWWTGRNTATIVFSSFAIGILFGLVFLPNAAKVIRWFKSVRKELDSGAKK